MAALRGHAEIRRRVTEYDEDDGINPEPTNMGLLLRQAHKEGISDVNIILDAVNYAATFLLMSDIDTEVLRLSDEIELTVMSGPTKWTTRRTATGG